MKYLKVGNFQAVERPTPTWCQGTSEAKKKDPRGTVEPIWLLQSHSRKEMT